MIKTVALVSLSAGTIGEDFVKHEVNIGLKRLEQFGLNVKIMPHAMKGIEYVKNHPKERANDLLAAICDQEVDMILCAIGGDDTYRLLPYLFENNELKEAIEKAEKKKIFLLHEKIKVTALIFVIPCGNVYLYNLSLAGNDCRDLCRP